MTLTKLCQVCCRIESEMLAVGLLEVLVFSNKSQVFLLVHFSVHDYLLPFNISIDSFTCGTAIKTLCRVPLNAVSSFWAAFGQVPCYKNMFEMHM